MIRLLPGAGWKGKWGTGSQRVEIFSCKISKFWGSEVLHAACSVSISLKFAQREIIQCTHRWTCNLLEYINYSVYESITWSICTQYIHTIFVRYTLVRLGKEKRVGGGAFLLWMVLSPGFTFHWWCILHTHVPESSSSSWGINPKGWAVLASNDAASHLLFWTAYLFQA